MTAEVRPLKTDEAKPVDSSSIEKSLSELWRSEKNDEHAVTRAALWNVVAHTANPRDHSSAGETLAKASKSVPQRAIVIQAELDAPSEISSWINSNCHIVSGEKQVCSEAVAIVAGGDRVRHIPPLVSALLIPDMPVAVWWLGDLPNDQAEYVEALLDPADRLIVDSTEFNSPTDLAWLRHISQRTTTAPADLNWVRLEDWRMATAAFFDPPAMRERLVEITSLRIAATGDGSGLFGHSIESLYYAAWINAQVAPGRMDEIEYKFDSEQAAEEPGALTKIHIGFSDGTEATIMRDTERHVLVAAFGGRKLTIDCVTRFRGRGPEDLIVRQLKRPEADRVFVKSLPIATALAARLPA